MMKKTFTTLLLSIASLSAADDTFAALFESTYHYESGKYSTSSYIDTHAVQVRTAMIFDNIGVGVEQDYIFTGSLYPQTIDVTNTTQGLGDTTLELALFLDIFDYASFALSGDIKIPAQNSALTTGGIDYTLRAELDTPISDGIMLSGLLDYTFMGDTTVQAYEDVLHFIGGVNFSFWSMKTKLYYNYYSAFISGASQSESVGLSLNIPLWNMMILTTHYEYGLTQNIAENAYAIGFIQLF